ncbi:MAG: hypothetical protein ACRDHY_00495, partial [Anaerolineales bacterium]
MNTATRTTPSLRARLSGLIVAACAAAALGVAAPASAYENVEPAFENFSVIPSNAQAGGHPNVAIDLLFNQDDQSVCVENCLYARRQSIHWPEGFIGNPHVTPKCTLTEFATASCPVDSQIGKFILTRLGIYVPIYNMETRPDQAGQLGFTAPLIAIPILFELSSRTDSDYGLEAISSPQMRLIFNHFQLELWGVPADKANDPERFFTPLSGFGGCRIVPGTQGCPPGSPFGSPTFAPSTSPPAPFLQNPTTCGVPLTASGDIEYYGGAAGHAEYPWPATTGCNQASFTPSVSAKPTTSSADTASGMDAILKVPQTQSAATPSPSELKT